MGFSVGAYAKVWEVKDGRGNYGEARLSVSRKNKDTDEYETTFSGFVRLVGDANKNRPTEGQRIKITSCDITNFYSKEKGITYWNPILFGFEDASGSRTSEGFVDVSDGNQEEIPW